MPKKVLYITSVGYIAGGAESSIVKVNPYLTDKDYSLKILASDMGADKKHFSSYIFKSINSSDPLKLLFFLFNPSAFFVLKKVLYEYKPDIVHLHVMNQVTPSVLFLLKKYPTVMTLHGPEAFLSNLVIWFMQPSCFKNNFYDKKNLNTKGKLTYLYFNYVQKALYKLVLKNIDLFIAPSKYIKKLAESEVRPVMHLPNFIEPGEFHELQHNHNLLFVGRLEKVKGVEFLIKAMALITSVFPQTTLTIIGDGADKADLLSLTKELQLERHIQFMGWVENKEVDAYYEKASIVVIPSIWPENFPTVCNEAMRMGRPVIGTNVGGIPEMIDDGVNGYLVEPKNPQQIAEKVIQIFSEESLLKELGRNACKKAEEFNPEAYIEKLDKIYETVQKKYKIIER